MTNANGHLTVTRNGRAVQIQRLSAATYYQALRTFGVSEAVAQALTVGLITIKKGE